MHFVPLHVHTEYSLLDGAIRVRDLVDFAKNNDMPAVAITDHGVMYSAIEFYEYAEKVGVKPLVGCEFYMHNGDIHEKNKENNPCYHLILIAKNEKGYFNLIKLVSTAWCEGMYYHPRINMELLEKHHEGLICCSACLGGELLQVLMKDGREKAIEVAKKQKELFGDDYYIELQDHGLSEQKRTNPELISIAKELGIKMVITNDSHYLKKEDADMHDTLLCLQTGKNKDDEKRFRFETTEFYVKTQDEMRDAFRWMDADMFEECVKNTEEIANKCDLHIKLHDKSLFPEYKVPDGYTQDSYLSYLVMEGLKKRYGENISEDLKKRALYELSVIEKMGFPGYFLITWDFIHFAKTHDVPVGPGRGSAAGSLVAYALEITDIDPIYHKLLFERFLNPERFTMPDIDIDFCIEKRGQVIDYVQQKYGKDKVCQIITFSTYAPKAAFKGVGRVLQVPFTESNRLCGLIEPALEIAKTTNPKAEWLKDAILAEGSELKTLYDEDYQIYSPDTQKNVSFKRWVDMAIAIEGLKCGTGTHAAGVIICNVPLDTVLPIQPSKDGIIQTGYPKHEATEVLDLLKMDFLGLRNLTMITKTVELIEQGRGIKVDINNIPLDDKPTYEMLTKGDTVGVFQLESEGMKNLVRRLKPDVFDDLGALVALFRPGPLGSGMVDDFVARKHGEQEITYAHPLLEPVLKDTYGTIVYQEQIMKVFQVLADYSLGQADQVRRMMGKKDLKAMEEQKDKFIEASAKHDMKKEDAINLFNQILAFASYCFNQSHSAAYAFVAYQTAYLKRHYPVEYLSCLLSSVSDNKEQTQKYLVEAQKTGIKVLPPDINKSDSKFTPDGDNIRFGLGSIKGIGDAVLKFIEEERAKNGEFKSIADFTTRINPRIVNRKAMENLSRAGAFDCLEPCRKKIYDNIDNILNSAQKEAAARELGQVSLFAALGGTQSGNSYQMQAFELYGTNEEFSDKEIQEFEKDLLGFYVTSHPLESIRDKLPFLTTHNIIDMENLADDSNITICGLISSVRQIPTKKDPTKFLKAGVIEDLTGEIEFVAFHKTLQSYNSLIELEKKVIMSGKLQKREENRPQIIVESIKPVENSNIVTIAINKNMNFERLIALKDLLSNFKGDDPIVIKADNDGEEKRVLVSSNFWTNASNELTQTLEKNFANSISVSISSLE